MKITVLRKKVTGIIMAALIAVSTAAVSVSAEGGFGDTVTEPNTIAREIDAQEWELIDPASITDANATAGGSMSLMVTFTEAFAEGYEIQINFTTASGVTKTYTASTQVPPMKTNYSCIPIRDIFDKLGLSGQELSSVTITGRSAGQITKIEYISGRPTFSAPAAATVSALDSESDSDAAQTSATASTTKDKNPSTGVADLTLPILLTCFCGSAIVITSKSRRLK